MKLVFVPANKSAATTEKSIQVKDLKSETLKLLKSKYKVTLMNGKIREKIAANLLTLYNNLSCASKEFDSAGVNERATEVMGVEILGDAVFFNEVSPNDCTKANFDKLISDTSYDPVKGDIMGDVTILLSTFAKLAPTAETASSVEGGWVPAGVKTPGASTAWMSGTDTGNAEWIKLDMGAEKLVTHLYCTFANGRDGSDVKLQGSTDDATWDDLHDFVPGELWRCHI